MENRFWYKNWWLFYLLFFLLLGLFIYALLWHPRYGNSYRVEQLEQQLRDCREKPTQESSKTVDYNATVKSGGQGHTITKHTLGDKAGKVIVEYAQ